VAVLDDIFDLIKVGVDVSGQYSEQTRAVIRGRRSSGSRNVCAKQDCPNKSICILSS
jgi:hypothetical protein